MIRPDATLSERLLPEGKQSMIKMNFNFHKQNRWFRSYRFLLSVNLIILTMICLYGKFSINRVLRHIKPEIKLKSKEQIQFLIVFKNYRYLKI